MTRAAIIVGLMLSFTAAAAAAHPVHVTMGEAHHRPERGVIEVALQVPAHDLNAALAAAGTPVRLDDAASGETIFAWLRPRFGVTNVDGRPAPLEWVGHEAQMRDVWLYFEIAVPKSLSGLCFRDSIFADVSPTQVNTLHLYAVDGMQTFVFGTGRTEVVVD